jgi:hypothetical protein
MLPQIPPQLDQMKDLSIELLTRRALIWLSSMRLRRAVCTGLEKASLESNLSLKTLNEHMENYNENAKWTVHPGTV